MTPDECRQGHRRRLRERFDANKPDGLADYELLELLLTFSIPRRDVKPVAKELLARFHSFPGVLDASPEELEGFPGLGLNTATLLKLIRVANIRYLTRKMESLPLLNSPELFADYARTRLCCNNTEKTLIFYLNAQNRLIECDFCGSGSPDAVTVYPSEVVRGAVVRGATGVVLSHNHPGGNCFPSREDDSLTLSITQALAPLGIKLLDHLVVTKTSYYSYRCHEHDYHRSGLLTKLKEGEME